VAVVPEEDLFMKESQRKADAAWEYLEGLDMKDPEYNHAMREYLVLAEDARIKRYKGMQEMLNEVLRRNEALLGELDEVKDKLSEQPAEDPCDEEFLEEISS
jgi:hypothetical protein